MTQTSPKPNPQNINNLNGSSASVPLEEDFTSTFEDFQQTSVPLSEENTDTQPSKLLTLEAPESDWETSDRKSNWQLPQWWQKLRLQTKATVIAMAIGTIPVLAIGTLSYQIASQQIEDNVIYQQQSRTISSAELLSRFMVERYGDIDILAHLPILTNSQGTAEVTNQQKQALLDQYVKSYGVYDSIAFFDLNGNVKLQSSGKALSNHRERKYFQEVIKTGKPVISDPGLSKSTGEYVIHLAAPVFEVGTGKMIGVVQSRLPVKYISEILSQENHSAKIKRFQSQEVLVADSEGRYFVAKEADEMGILVQEDFSIFPKLQAAKKLDTQVYLNPKEKISELLTYLPAVEIKGLPDLNWSLLVVNPASEAFAAQRQLLLTFLLGMCIAMLVVGQIAVFLAERAIRPILAAASAVEKIGQGDLDVRLEVQGEDELAVLGTNINQMTQQLNALVQEQTLSAEQARFLAEIAGTMIPDQQALEALFQQALEGARNLLQTERVVIYRLNPDGSGYIANEALEAGWASTLDENVGDRCIPAQLLEAYRQGRRIVPTPDVFQADFHPAHLQLMERLQIKANLVVSILNQGQLFGLLIAHHCSHPHQWQEGEINFCKQVAQQLQVALERISLNQQRQEEANRAEMLKDITLKIAGAVNQKGVFDTAVQEVRHALKSDRTIIYRFDETWKGKILVESVADNFPRSLGAEIADPCFAEGYVEKYKQGRVRATANIYEAGLTPCHLKQLEPFAVKANIVAPILMGGKLLGLLIAHQCSSPRNWEKPEIDFFSQVATQVGFALERADLVEQQRLGEEEQRGAKEKLQQRAMELLLEVDPLNKGDLTIRAKVTEDEIGTIADSYNATIESLRRIVRQVQTAAQQVAQTTGNNEVSVRSLSTEALIQTENIAQALASIQSMSESIRAVSANAQKAETAVQHAAQTVETGEQAMNRTVDGIMAIRETVAETAKKVKRLGESSQKISKVVNLISSFADQTNLLALNASIEAAHAGEQGRGFAVVADEVRSLARQSAEATAEIEGLVANIQSETNEVVAAMETGTEQVVTGTKLVDETRKSLNQITAASAQINELVEEIAKAALEQSQTSQTVTETMTQVAAVSDKTSIEAAQVSDSFKQLLDVAQALQESVRRFMVS